MKMWLRAFVMLTVVSSLVLLCPRGALADDAGVASTCMSDFDCAATPGTPYCGMPGQGMPNSCVACIDYAGKPCLPVACDGGLCDTTNGSGCSVAGGLGRSQTGSPILVVTVLGAVALAIARRRGRHAAERLR